MRIEAVSIFPDYFQPLELSLLGKAREAGLVKRASRALSASRLPTGKAGKLQINIK